MQSRQRQGEFFNRFSYDITPDINVYVQGSWAESGDYSTWAPLVGQLGQQPAQHLLHQQPLSLARRANRADGGGHRGRQFRQSARSFLHQPQFGSPARPGRRLRANTPFFSDPSYISEHRQRPERRSRRGDIYQTKGVDRNLSMTTGLTGKLPASTGMSSTATRKAGWQVNDPTNTNNARYLASQDAVIAPAGTHGRMAWMSAARSSAGSRTQPQFATLYPGCVPINVFDPNQGITQAA